MDDDAASVAQFVAVTGASTTDAAFFLESAKGNLENAIDQFFEHGGAVPPGGGGGAGGGGAAPNLMAADGMSDDDADSGVDEQAIDEATEDEPPARNASPSLDDLAQEMFDKAEKSRPSDDERGSGASPAKKIVFTGKGYALGKTPEAVGADAAPSAPAAPAAPAQARAGASAPAPVVDKPPPKTYKVTMWKDSVFQVDDGEVRHPTDPVNRAFVADLAKGWVPEELRERNETGAPVPVHINLEDRRQDHHSEATVKKPDFKAFSGGGYSLGKDWLPEAQNKVQQGAAVASSAAAAAAAPTSNPTVLASLAPDESKPICTVQIRTPATGGRAEARLNSTRTVGDLRRWVVANGMVGSGQDFILMGGFPPKPLEDEGASLESAGLNGAAITLKIK